MLEVSGWRPDGVQEKKGKKCVKSLGKKRIGEKTVHDSPRQRAIKSSFIHTVSSNYQCIYSIP